MKKFSKITRENFATQKNWCSKLSLTAVGAVIAGTPAFAQDQIEAQNQYEFQDIIVTAQRREQSQIDVPASITALSGEKLDELGLSNLPDVAQQVPNFDITYENGRNSVPNFTLRGVRGDNLGSRLNESSVAIYTDEAFIGSEFLLNGALFDTERVEILRGPQGTVFGKNTTGGLVHFISAKPTNELSGHASVETGSNYTFITEGAVSGPITQGVRARLAGRFERDDGHYKNEYLGAGKNGVEKNIGDTKVWGLRGIVDIDLSDRTLLRLIGAYSENDSQTTKGRTLGTLLPGTTGPGPYTRADMCDIDRILAGKCITNIQADLGGLPVKGRPAGAAITNLTPKNLAAIGNNTSATATLTHEFDWATFTSITNYMSGDFRQIFDGDGGATPSINVGLEIVADRTNESSQFSQEFRLSGSSDAIDWVTGLYYYNDDKYFRQITDIRSSNLRQVSIAEVDTRSYAAFAQLDAHISDTITLTLGGRYTNESRKLARAETSSTGVITSFQNVLEGVPDQVVSQKDFTGKFGLTWEPTDDSTYYASYSRGIKSAGFNGTFSPLSTVASNAQVAGPVGQEVLDSFEIGAKNRFFNRKLSINSAIFYYDFSGKQENIFTLIGDTVQGNYINVGNSRMYGIETEISYAPSRYFDMSLSWGLIDTEITDSDVITPDTFGVLTPLEGKELAQTPPYTFSGVFSFHVPTERLGEFTIQPEVRGMGKRFFGLTNEPLATDEEHIFANLRLLWKSADARFNAQAFVTNVFDEAAPAQFLDIVIGSSGKLNSSELEGRLWGLKFGYNF